MTAKRMVIIGAAGVGREVRWLLECLSQAGQPHSFVGYVVSDLARLGSLDSSNEVLGDLSWLRQNKDSFDGLALAIGNPAHRAKIATQLENEFPAKYWPALVHPKANWDAETCKLEHGAIVQAGATLTVHVRMGAFSMVHVNATLGHEVEIGRASAVFPGANVGGGVHVAEGVMVGSGAQVLQYLHVGAHAKIGAGAVVTKDVGANLTVVGIPARIVPA